ncbi:MAG: Trk system potassium transporter TrkA [bacterium]|nr:Trk system potassium transporter TrkA [bacterium]
MKILIIGAGEVGYHLSAELVRENHDVVIVEPDSERIQRVAESRDVMVVQGDGTRQKVLEEAGIAHCDMLIAVTNSDDVNILACMIAREFGVKTKIARVRDHELSDPDSVLNPARIGIDLMIHPELEAAREIIRLIRHPSATEVSEFFDGRVELLGVRVTKDSPALGKTLIDLGRRFTDLPYRIVAIARREKTLIPKGDQRLEQDDQIYVVTRREALQEVFKVVSSENRVNRDLMILGARRVGILVAQGLRQYSDISVKLVDPNPENTQRAAKLLPGVLVVEADGLDIDVISAEGLIDMNVFIACTDNDENNIVTSLVARHLGVPRTITLVEKRFYLPIIKTLGLEVAVNKHLLTSNAILKYIRHGKVLSFSQIRGINAETIVYSVEPNAKITRKPLESLDFPDGSILGAIHRGNEFLIPTGKTQVRAGDEALIFYLPEVRNKLNNWFN